MLRNTQKELTAETSHKSFITARETQDLHYYSLQNMSGFELIAPLVMNVLPPAIDFFLCQSGRWQDEEFQTIFPCCSPMNTSTYQVQDDEDDHIVVAASSSQACTEWEGRKRASSSASFPRKHRPVQVSKLSLEDDRGGGGGEEEEPLMDTSWYCFAV